MTTKLEHRKNTLSFRINGNGVNQTVDPEKNEKEPLIKKERSTNTKTIKIIKEKNLETDPTEETNEDKDSVTIQTGDLDENKNNLIVRTKDTNHTKTERVTEEDLLD